MTKPKLDTVVVITVLTPNADRRDQIDLAIEKAFGDDPRVQVIRVVGYPSSDADSVAEFARKIAEVTAEPPPARDS